MYINYHLKGEVYIVHSMNQEVFETNFCNKSSHCEIYGQFPWQKEAITFHRQIDTFCCR